MKAMQVRVNLIAEFMISKIRLDKLSPAKIGSKWLSFQFGFSLAQLRFTFSLAQLRFTLSCHRIFLWRRRIINPEVQTSLSSKFLLFFLRCLSFLIRFLHQDIYLDMTTGPYFV